MKNRDKVISVHNLPSRIPLWSTLTCWLILDKINAPEWLWGVIGFLFLIGWAVAIHGLITEEKVDIFNK